jgi:hypothetical protein
MMEKREEMEEINESFINGQNEQAKEYIKDLMEVMRDCGKFWHDYRDFLIEWYGDQAKGLKKFSYHVVIFYRGSEIS